ncbi:MAG: C4-type zinc ribbon domain-containing protein [Candidatus Omnitrophota bacterium]
MENKNTIKEQIGKLIEVQELDSEKFDLESQIEMYPSKIEELDQLLQSKKTHMLESEEELKKIQVLKGDKETEMMAKEEKIAKHKTDLYQIKSNKEYSALQQEIKSIEADVSLLEEEIINCFDKIEDVQKIKDEAKAVFETEAKKIEEEKNSIKEKEKQLAVKISELEAKRKELISRVDPSILERYERILNSKGKLAIAKLSGGFCGGCNMQLRPQVINDVKLQKDLVFCENCSRILYVEE